MRAAITAWNYLANPQGGFDWAGLPTVCALLGEQDPERLVRNLMTIKCHRPASAGAGGAKDA